MKPYTHLSPAERYHISYALTAGHTQKEIAAQLQRSPSCISRESRRLVGRAYQADQAIIHAKRPAQRGRYIDASIWLKVQANLAKQWRPEQISTVLKKENQGRNQVSTETIYAWIYQSPELKLHTHLLRKHRQRKSRKRNKKSCIIKDRRDIDTRPSIVDTRSRVGDFEADTIVGKNSASAMLTLNDRATGIVLVRALPNRSAQAVHDAMLYLLTPFKGLVHTITSDNGSEFARHQDIASALGIDFFFAKPHHPWQRGSNENANGLIRQYCPKGTDLRLQTEADVHRIMHRLNHRPRKRFDYLSPLQQFEKLTGITQAHDLIRIALQV